jgi:hypothetical protein
MYALTLSAALVHRIVPDVFSEPGNMACSIAGVPLKLQLSFADR